MTHLNALRARPLFICGHPKAGTSLLRAIFDSHPQLIVYPEETVFFRRFLPQSAGLDLESQLVLAEHLLIHIFHWSTSAPVPDQDDFPGRDYSAIPFDDVRSEMRKLAGAEIRHPGDILSAVVLAYGQASGQNGERTRRWVEKSPYNEYYARQIFEWWPEARCIHIVRDPRDNYLSYRRKHPDWTAEFFAANWTRSTRAGLDNRERYGPQRYLMIRFEDLVRDPEAQVRALTDFLEIEWDNALFAPTRAGEQWQGNSMFADQFQAISAAPVDRWKVGLLPVDAAVIELKAASLLEECGYSPEAIANGSFTQTLAARWRLLTWPFRRRLANWLVR
jgi:hypothetical protein